MIIGLTGTYCAGKGEIASYLKNKGFEYFSLSDELRAIANEKCIQITRENLIRLGNEMRKEHGPSYLARRVIKKIKGNTVVDSIRNPSEVEALRKIEGFILVSVDAPVELRYNRSQERGRPEDKTTLAEFIKHEKQESVGADTNCQQLWEVTGCADVKIINDAGKEELHHKISEILNRR